LAASEVRALTRRLGRRQRVRDQLLDFEALQRDLRLQMIVALRQRQEEGALRAGVAHEIKPAGQGAGRARARGGLLGLPPASTRAGTAGSGLRSSG